MLEDLASLARAQSFLVPLKRRNCYVELEHYFSYRRIDCGPLGLSGIAGAATQIAWILFVVFLVLFLVSLVMEPPPAESRLH